MRKKCPKSPNFFPQPPSRRSQPQPPPQPPRPPRHGCCCCRRGRRTAAAAAGAAENLVQYSDRPSTVQYQHSYGTLLLNLSHDGHQQDQPLHLSLPNAPLFAPFHFRASGPWRPKQSFRQPRLPARFVFKQGQVVALEPPAPNSHDRRGVGEGLWKLLIMLLRRRLVTPVRTRVQRKLGSGEIV